MQCDYFVKCMMYVSITAHDITIIVIRCYICSLFFLGGILCYKQRNYINAYGIFVGKYCDINDNHVVTLPGFHCLSKGRQIPFGSRYFIKGFRHFIC